MSIGGLSSGMMDFSSIQAQIKERMTERFNSADTDGSNGLSLEEFNEASKDSPLNRAGSASGLSSEELFAELDTDGNGEVTGDEFKDRFNSRSGNGLAASMLPQLLSLQEQSGGLSSMIDTSGNFQSNTFDQLMEMLGSGSEDERR
ncbi:EF-hand domain-containing protein [Roseibium alexandrii]|uniref:EF hand n=1 Tax=Roseibium alexandrii TaxID=388408 RepID=A0A0M7ARW6_9HYPH|nr:EF-hand domain-containing protein [Roseibium alexandrii]CTQ76543.1 EF hand [Roseibium alexandrii]